MGDIRSRVGLTFGVSSEYIEAAGGPEPELIAQALKPIPLALI